MTVITGKAITSIGIHLCKCGSPFLHTIAFIYGYLHHMSNVCPLDLVFVISVIVDKE